MKQIKSFKLFILSLFLTSNLNAQTEYIAEISAVAVHLDSIYWSDINSKKCETSVETLTPILEAHFPKITSDMRVSVGAGISNYVCKATEGANVLGDIVYSSFQKTILQTSQTHIFGDIVIEKLEGTLMNPVTADGVTYTKTTEYICHKAVFTLSDPYPYIQVLILSN